MQNAAIEVCKMDSFENLCNRVSDLVYCRKGGYGKELRGLLEKLVSLDFGFIPLKKERGLLLINHCCHLIPPDDVESALNANKLFTNLITKGSLVVEGVTLTTAVSWCLLCLQHDIHKITVLKCLRALAKGNGKEIERQNNASISQIEQLSSQFTFVPGAEELSVNSLRYVEALTYSPGSKTESLSTESIHRCFAIFKEVLFKGKSNLYENEIPFCKFLITAIRGLSNLIQMSDDVVANYLGELLGIVKGYMLYGLLGHENYQVQKLFPTSISIPEVLKPSLQVGRKLRGKYDRRSKKVAVTSLNDVEDADESHSLNDYVSYAENSKLPGKAAFSESNRTSDSDSDLLQNSKLKFFQGKVRHSALILLGTIVQKTSPKSFIAFIPSFLPDGSGFQHMRTLMTCLENDPSSKCRYEIVGVLLMIISNCRQYFLQADGLSKSSFTTFSCTISNTIKELHRGLIKALNSERNGNTLQRVLKCISDLVRSTPFHKMEPGLLTDISRNVRPFLKHNDVIVQIFALTVFGCIISAEPKVKELSEIILGSPESGACSGNTERAEDCNVPESEVIADDDDYEIYDEEETETSGEKPWLFDHCLGNFKSQTSDTTNVALQVESFQVIGALARNFFRETIVGFPGDVIDLLKESSARTEYSIRLYSAKLMATVLDSLQFSFCHEDESKRPSITLAVQLWEALLPGPITSLIQDQEEPMLRCTGCDCIANVGIQNKSCQTTLGQNSLIFDQLPRDKQIMCLTLLFGCLRDEASAVRSSAARALAIFVLFPSLREDSLFFLDVIDAALAAADDDQIVVRVQTAWLFGNLSESVVTNRKSGVDDDVSPDLIGRLLRIGIKLANDGPKMKPGAVRGLGNLLQIVTEDFLKEHKEVVVESLDALIKNATTGTLMKARWNSCYAIANLLQNPLIHSNPEWISKIFNVMMSLVQHYKNFKVRISAGLVLRVPPTRDSYGDLYNSVWSATLNGLENSKNISDFNEYQHRDQLVDQLCLVTCHLVTLISPTDLMSLQDVLYFHLDNLSHFMGKFHERIVPEKSSVLLRATEKIHLLLDEKGLCAEEKSVLRVLENLFVSDG